MKRVLVFLIILNIGISVIGGISFGKEIKNEEEILLDEIDYSEIQKVINKSTNRRNIDFKHEVANVVKSGQVDYESYVKKVCKNINVLWESKKKSLFKIIIITIFIAIFSNFVNTMGSDYVAQTSFIMSYMLLMITVIDIFKEIYTYGCNIMNVIKRFIEVLVPTYTVASLVGTGVNSSTAFNQISMIIIMIIENVFIKVLFPLVNIYMIIVVVNNICSVNGMIKFSELIKLLIKWGIKGAIILVTSLSAVQRLVANTSDEASRKLIGSGIKMVPYVGSSVENINETLFQATGIIKNAIGAVGIISLIIICIVPIINIVINVFVYNCLTALVEPISDIRVVNCIKSIADSSKLILEIIVTSIALFFITIALMAL